MMQDMSTTNQARNAEAFATLKTHLAGARRAVILELVDKATDRKRFGQEACGTYQRMAVNELAGSRDAYDLLVAALSPYRADFRWGDERDAAQAQRNTMLDDIAAMASGVSDPPNRDS